MKPHRKDENLNFWVCRKNGKLECWDPLNMHGQMHEIINSGGVQKARFEAARITLGCNECVGV